MVQLLLSNAFSNQAAARSGREPFNFAHAHLRTHPNRKNVNKSKGPDKYPGLWQIGLFLNIRGPLGANSLVLFRLLFRRRQAFEALQQLFLGHALDRNFGVVGIDAGAGRADQRHGVGFGLVDLDELLQ